MRIVFLTFCLFSSAFFFGQTYSPDVITAAPERNIQIVQHAFYKIGFDTKQKLPAWVYYSLSKEHLSLANLDRKGSFVKDPLLNQEQSCSRDYSGSGFDKGHMVPCEDMSFSEQTMKETFYYSNCAPQTTELNRGEWKVLEELVREWAIDFHEAMVICGPVFKPLMPKMGVHAIPVPDLFYKIIVVHKDNHYSALAFLMPNSRNTLLAPVNYTCTIDSVETLTGLDFFSTLPDKTEEQFEGKINVTEWNWNIHHTNKRELKNDSLYNKDSTIENTISVQCKGKTKKGKRCTKKTISKSGLCDLHD